MRSGIFNKHRKTHKYCMICACKGMLLPTADRSWWCQPGLLHRDDRWCENAVCVVLR